jgi:hypothetical protein
VFVSSRRFYAEICSPIRNAHPNPLGFRVRRSPAVSYLSVGLGFLAFTVGYRVPHDA